MFVSFLTDRSQQTQYTQSRQLLQSDQGLHCLPFRLHLLDTLLYGKTTMFKFQDNQSHVFGVPNFFYFYIHIAVRPSLKIFWFGVYCPTHHFTPTERFFGHLKKKKKLFCFFKKQFSLELVSFSWTGSKQILCR